MRITKKIVAVVLCLALLASHGLSAFASSEPESEETVSTETTDILLDGEASYEEPAEEDTSTPDEEDEQASQEAAALALSDAQDEEIYMTVETDTYINPIYADIQLPMDEVSLPLDGATTTVPAPVDSDYYQTIEEAAGVLRDGMEKRQVTVTTTLKSTAEVSYTEIFEKAIEHTGVPTQGDYLRLNYYKIQVGTSRITYKNAYYYTYTFTFTYLDNAEEEAAVAVAAEALISSLEPADDSRYALLCAVYDAVTQTIDYDYEHDDDYLSKYSTYSAAVQHLTVCQGYASYMYRLLLSLGIPCRCIKGTSPGGSHAWNIVEIDGLYYDLDATWDAGKTSYSYFLKGEEEFAESHTREEACSTEEFMAAYPMSSVDYNNDTATHNFVESSRTEATCTEPGKILYICSDCDREKEETIPSTGHAYGDWAVETAATCEGTGTEQRVCVHDASHVETRITDALGHDYDNGVVAKQATCKENGVMTYTCKNDASHTYTTEISNAGIAHTYGEWTIDTPATCETAGVKSRTCSVCEARETEEITALGHAYGEWTVATAATCTTTGTEQRVCVHDASHVETRITDALGHDYDNGVVAKQATCKENGVMTYTCKNDASHTYTTEISNAGIAHTYGAWTVDKAATCTAKGSLSRTCTVCGNKETAEIAALGHNYDSGVVTKKATCKANGVMTYTCQNDASHTYTTAISNAGISHTYGAWTVDKAATCTAKGSQSRTCTVCGNKETTEIAALGHSYNSGVVTKPATTTSTGVKTYTCTRCSASYTKTIPQLTPTLSLGDVNGDGSVNLKDVTKLFQYVNKQISSLEHEEVSDINHDGAINLKDVTKLFQYVNKQITSLG
jgi:transglutaminase-like putative cysteine protease